MAASIRRNCIHPRRVATRVTRPAGRSAKPPLLDPEFLHKLEQLELVSRKIFVGRMKGERKSKRRGSSVEFADHRNYTVGDDLRHIDWNVYGRLDKLFLKLFLEEEDLHVYTLLDTSLSMDFGTPTKLHYGKQVAAALAFIGLVNHDRVILDTFASKLDQGIPSVRGRSQMWRVVQYLEHLERLGRERPDGRGHASSRSATPARASSSSSPTSSTSTATRTPCATCWRGTWTSTSSTSSARRRSSPSSSATSAWSTSRTTTIAEITISAPLLKRYKDNLNAFVGGLKEWCTKRGITYIFTTNQYPVRQADPELPAGAGAGQVSQR